MILQSVENVKTIKGSMLQLVKVVEKGIEKEYLVDHLNTKNILIKEI